MRPVVFGNTGHRWLRKGVFVLGTIKPQWDYQKRVVSLRNLKEMCRRISGMCHKFTVVKETKNRVYIEYSNPDEYGNEWPVRAIFPAYVTDSSDPCGGLSVVMDILRVEGQHKDHDDVYQYFWQLIDHPSVWRDPVSGNWFTDKEIEERKQKADGEKQGPIEAGTGLCNNDK